MEKYIPIKPKSFKRRYNLPIKYLTEFRNKFGISYSDIDENEFRQWCEDNDITLYKFVTEVVEIKINEY
jgi:uncharacterized protein YlxP (DUF503 family)